MRFHSPETALLKVQTDILDTLDKRSLVVLGVMDLSAAFDTLDDSILLQHYHTAMIMRQRWSLYKVVFSHVFSKVVNIPIGIYRSGPLCVAGLYLSVVRLERI